MTHRHTLQGTGKRFGRVNVHISKVRIFLHPQTLRTSWKNSLHESNGSSRTLRRLHLLLQTPALGWPTLKPRRTPPPTPTQPPLPVNAHAGDADLIQAACDRLRLRLRNRRCRRPPTQPPMRVGAIPWNAPFGSGGGDDSAHADLANIKVSFRCGLWVTLSTVEGGLGWGGCWP